MDVHETVLQALRDAGEPVRESVLYERVLARGADLDPQAFIAVLEHMGTDGRLHVAFDHDSAIRDPEPFAPRSWLPS